MTVPNSFTPATVISSVAVNADFSDIATELTNSVAVDGQSTMTGALKGSNGAAATPSHTFGADADTGMYRRGADQLGFATAGVERGYFDTNGDLVLIRPLPIASNGLAIFLATTVGGTANAITVSASSPAATGFALANKPIVMLTPAGANTAAATLNFNATGALAVVKETPSGLVALSGGELVTAVPSLLFCDGTQYILLNQSVLFGTAASLASAGTTDLGTIGSHNILITGTTGITSFGSSANVAQPIYIVKFAGAVTVTHNGTSLVLPGLANINAQAGDVMMMEYAGSGNWKCLSYEPISVFPTVQRFTSGTSLTYTPTAGTRYIRVRMVGGGGGGGATNTNNGSNAGFSSFAGWVAGGGGGGAASTGAVGTGASGGASGTGTLITRVDGQPGGQGANFTVTTASAGGSSVFGGGGQPGGQNANGIAARGNTGSGGSGGTGQGGSSNAGSGGGAGEYVEFFMSAAQVGASQTYTVGAAGAGGAAGGQAGGNGAAGIIIVEEFP